MQYSLEVYQRNATCLGGAVKIQYFYDSIITNDFLIHLSFLVSPHPSEHYTVVSSNGYMPPPAHMFGRAFQESRNSTAGRHSAAVHHPATRSATRLVDWKGGRGQSF